MSRQWTRRRTLQVGATFGLLGAAGCQESTQQDPPASNEPLPVSTARQFNSPQCSCCSRYAAYLGERVTGRVDATVPDDMAAVKHEYGIPRELQSCHTVVLEEYVVEGHVPTAAIATLLEDAPEIDGIALPGMPAGSPGMGGTKDGPFRIYAIGGEAGGSVYIEV